MQDKITVLYQPVVDDANGSIFYYEALARVNVPGRPCNSHQSLIATGEDFGFVYLIDTAALRHVGNLLRQDLRLVISVNVSVASLQDSLARMVTELFSYADVCNRLVFEITETVPIRDLEQVSRFINVARLLKARVAFDDFGDGHFSIPLIESLKPDYVKLAGSLVRDLMINPLQLRDLQRAVKPYGGILIAEFVDSEEKRQILRRLDITHMQGFLFGKPTREPARLLVDHKLVDIPAADFPLYEMAAAGETPQWVRDGIFALLKLDPLEAAELYQKINTLVQERAHDSRKDNLGISGLAA